MKISFLLSLVVVMIESCSARMLNNLQATDAPLTTPAKACPLGWRASLTVTNKCYYIGDAIQNEGWNGANFGCQLLPDAGALTSIANGFENSEIADFQQSDSYWIGLASTGPQHGGFQWTDGRPVTYSNWAPGEPSIGEGCVFVEKASGQWFVAGCADNHGVQCELYL